MARTTTRLNLLVEEDDHALLARLALQADRSMSSMVRAMIRDAALTRGLLPGAQPPPEQEHHQ